MRIGTKKKPFYRVVVVDERSKRTGAYVESLGTYNPLTEPKEIKVDQSKVDQWVKKGAQLSDGYLRMSGKAPQRPPRKPKKQKEETVAPAVEQPKQETAAAEEKPAEEITPPEENQPAGEEPAKTAVEESTQSESPKTEDVEKKDEGEAEASGSAQKEE